MSRDRLGKRWLWVCLGLAVTLGPAWASSVRADVKLPAIFSRHMVLQRDRADRVWGHAEPGEDVVVSIAHQTKSTKADDKGHWSLSLDPMPAGGPHTLTVKGKNSIVLDDVLVGEVWLCSGQSNMQWSVKSSNDSDLEIKSANYPAVRLISVPMVGTQQPQDDFRGEWVLCSPETVGSFSGVGYFFGRQLYQTLGIPIGLIHDSWGGSACEAWVRRDLLAADVKYKPLMAHWEKIEQGLPDARTSHEEKLRLWERAAAEAKSKGKIAPPKPQHPDVLMNGNHRPGNLYNGMIQPVLGYGLRGMIWYQGESNAGRAYQYRDLFPLMIQSWRDAWGIGDFPFYWVQLADFMGEKTEPAESAWAELREAQTMTMSKLPHTGQAVIIDLGEAKDIHPKNKQDVAKRLARWALARDYGISVPDESPTYKDMEKKGSKILLTFAHVGNGLKTFDVIEPSGFTIAGSDHHFVPAKAKLVGKDEVEVWSDGVSEPVAVRYAWADNPICNLYSDAGLPATPFRTDDWAGVTAGKDAP